MIANVCVVVASHGVPYLIRRVEKGETFGLDFCLTHDQEDPFIEFYDARHRHGPFGQFVSRYYLSTLKESSHSHYLGINLHGGEDDWKIDGKAYQFAMKQLTQGEIS